MMYSVHVCFQRFCVFLREYIFFQNVIYDIFYIYKLFNVIRRDQNKVTGVEICFS